MADVKHYQAVPFAEGKYSLGEGPLMDQRTGILSFVDIKEGRFYRIMPDGRQLCFEAGQMIGAAVPAAKPGTYVFCGVDGLYRSVR